MWNELSLASEHLGEGGRVAAGEGVLHGCPVPLAHAAHKETEREGGDGG